MIRRMTLDDVPAVHRIDQNSFTLPWPERSLRYEVVENPAARCWVAEVDGEVVAMLVLWVIQDEVHIASLATNPDFRRQGMARKLLLTALTSAYGEGARSAFLEVRAGNKAALAMYHNLGFEAVGSRKRYYKDNGEDAILMTLDGMVETTEEI